MTRTILISLLAALALAAPAAASPGDDAGDLLDWVAEHPRKAGLAVYAGDTPLLRSADRRFALGSVRKVLILGAYARGGGRRPARPRRAGAGRRDRALVPPAHRRRRASGRGRGLDRARGARGRRRGARRGGLGDDPVVGQRRRRLPARAGRRTRGAALRRAPRHAPAGPARHLVRRVPGLDGDDPVALGAPQPRAPGAAAATAIARATPAQDAAGRRFPSIARQRRFAAVSTAGTPREWARLMRDLHAGRGDDAGRARDRPAPPRVAARRLPRARRAARAAGRQGRLAAGRGHRGGLRPGAGRRAGRGRAVPQRRSARGSSASWPQTYVQQELLLGAGRRPGRPSARPRERLRGAESGAGAQVDRPALRHRAVAHGEQLVGQVGDGAGVVRDDRDDVAEPRRRPCPPGRGRRAW